MSVSPVDRFWSRVDISTPDKCWEWKGPISKGRRYGVFYFNKKDQRVNRVSWQIAHGPIPAGMVVCHTCDNPKCVNPAHLFLGTQADNVHDMYKKGRAATRERRHNAKLTAEIVQKIREVYKPYDRRFSLPALARKYGVSNVTIYHALRGDTWKDEATQHN